MKTFVIGDIHGCLQALDTLLDTIKLCPQDQLITLGDYVDRGPNSREVIERLISLYQKGQLIPLKGNHEMMMLTARHKDFSQSDWVNYFGQETLASYGIFSDPQASDIPEEHWHFIEKSCLDGWETQDHIFVHANLDPHFPLAQQSDYQLFWEKFYQPIPHDSGKIMICGHTSQKDGLPLNIGYAMCIDTWVYGKGWLTALEVNSGQIWQANQKGETRMTDIYKYRMNFADLETLYRRKRKFC
ncbi:MAG: metallophosphoesterase family protein [Microcystaceae cyanobacterium]